jgi:hypothetical protein
MNVFLLLGQVLFDVLGLVPHESNVLLLLNDSLGTCIVLVLYSRTEMYG